MSLWRMPVSHCTSSGTAGATSTFRCATPAKDRRAGEALHHSRPGPRKIDAVVATTARPEHPPVPQLIGQQREIACRPLVDCGAVAHMGDGVTFEAVRSRLQQDEFRLVFALMCQ